jgi:menaquinone-9 beta-reductase
MKPITIVGGGLAGLTLGIFLRRENIPVTIHEASRYPRHRVCGEFLSGEGARILRGITGGALQANEATTAALFLRNKPPLQLRLTEPALCSSRFELDALLADHFQKLGGDLRTDSRLSDDATPGIVYASGRRRAEPGHGHLIGLKAHATNVSLAADLELHFSPNHYVGICCIPSQRVNVCGLFFSPDPIKDLQDRWPQILSGLIPSLQNANWLKESFCAVAAITLNQRPGDDRFTIGDAAAMIPPLTGNGMSMAIESASLASTILIDYAQGKIPWPEALSINRQKWSSKFSNRLRWANFTQRLAFSARSQSLLFSFAKMLPLLPNLIFSRTR